MNNKNFKNIDSLKSLNINSIHKNLFIVSADLSNYTIKCVDADNTFYSFRLYKTETNAQLVMEANGKECILIEDNEIIVIDIFLDIKTNLENAIKCKQHGFLKNLNYKIKIAAGIALIILKSCSTGAISGVRQLILTT